MDPDTRVSWPRESHMLRIYAMQKESEATSMIASRWSDDHRERLSYKICTTEMRATGVSLSPLPDTGRSDRWFETMTSYKHSSPSPFAGPAQAKRSRRTSGIGSSSWGPSPVLNGDPPKPALRGITNLPREAQLPNSHRSRKAG
jgi:hypothetical protein